MRKGRYLWISDEQMRVLQYVTNNDIEEKERRVVEELVEAFYGVEARADTSLIRESRHPHTVAPMLELLAHLRSLEAALRTIADGVVLGGSTPLEAAHARLSHFQATARAALAGESYPEDDVSPPPARFEKERAS